MSEWKKYNGSDEQIEEIRNAKNGFTFRYITAAGLMQSRVYTDINELQRFFRCDEIAEYIICTPYPNEGMICQQARTGQEVYVLEPILVPNRTSDTDFSIHETYSKKGKLFIREDGYWLLYITNAPNWYIPGAKYSFTEFKD